MEEQNDPRAAMVKAVDDLNDFLKRFKAFRTENAEYIQYLNEIGEENEENIKPLDPQDIQTADNFIKEIEDAGLEDEIEGFDEMKYKGEIYHQYRAFSAEGRAVTRRLTEVQLAFNTRMLNTYQGWLKNAQQAVAEGKGAADLPESIKKMEKGIAQLLQDKAKLELELAATHPNKVN